MSAVRRSFIDIILLVFRYTLHRSQLRDYRLATAVETLEPPLTVVNWRSDRLAGYECGRGLFTTVFSQVAASGYLKRIWQE